MEKPWGQICHCHIQLIQRTRQRPGRYDLIRSLKSFTIWKILKYEAQKLPYHKSLENLPSFRLNDGINHAPYEWIAEMIYISFLKYPHRNTITGRFSYLCHRAYNISLMSCSYLNIKIYKICTISSSLRLSESSSALTVWPILYGAYIPDLRFYSV